MRTGFADRLLDIAFRFAKVISVLLAILLVIAFLGGIGWSIKQSASGGGDETADVRFDNELNRLKSSMTGVRDDPAASSGAGIALSNEVRSKYGDALGKAMANAQCSTEQYETAMRTIANVSADDDTEPFVDDMVDGAVRWFNDAAAYQKSVGGAEPSWYCGEHYWEAQYERLQAKALRHQQRMLEILKGFGFSFMALLAAFALMVIPAIYRIEESLRNRAQP